VQNRTVVQFSLLESFYLFGTFHGIFMAATLLASGKSHRGTVYLALLILLFSFYLFENVLYASGYIRSVPWLFLTTLPLTFLIGPLFYFYARKSADIHFLIRPVHIIHLLPFMMEIALLSPFYKLDDAVKTKIYEKSINSTAAWSFNIIFVAYVVYFILACGYCIASYQISASAPAQSGSPRSRWLRHASQAMIVYLVIAMAMSCYLLVDGSPSKVFYHVNLILQTLLIQLVGYTAFVKPQVFHAEELNGPKYKFSSLSPERMDEYRTKLVAFINQEKPYLDPDVSVDHFSRKLGIPRHHLSQLLTEGLHTSFYDLLNGYRVKRAKELLLLDSYRHAKIIHIAYDSGFRNKSTFLRSFRKLTGQTPTDFRKQSEKEVALH